jgi:hypothetical protein
MKPSLRRPTRREFLGILGMSAGAMALSCFGSDDEPLATPGTGPGTVSDDASLEDMIGQMLMLGFRGYTLSSDMPIHAEIASGRVGNTVYFSYDVPSEGEAERNIESPAQVAALSARCRRSAACRT